MQIQLLLLGVYAALTLFLWYTVLNNKFVWTNSFLGPIVSLLPLAAVFPTQPRFLLDFFWWRIAGVIAIILGLGIYYWAISEFKKVNKEEPGKLIETGPYKYVRHPMYLGMLFVYVGWWWAWSAVYAFYFGMLIIAAIWLQALIEEKLFAEKTFGDKYREYRKITGMFWIK
jgi:protein-S-isoprenylcysteine O-methyltransferase Ste14